MDCTDLKFLTTYSFGTKCRTCLCSSSILHPVSNISFEDTTIAQLLNICMEIKVDEENLPEKMCRNCISKLCETRKFQTLCFRSQAFLEETRDYDISFIKKEVDVVLDPELIVVKGDDLCVECPSPYSLTESLKSLLICTGRTLHLCESCGNSCSIRYNGVVSGILTNNIEDAVVNKSESLSKDAFGSICRTCLAVPKVMHQIFDISFEDIPVKDLLKNCIQITIDANDNLPDHICEPCTVRLCEIYKFHKLSHESNLTLQQTLEYYKSELEKRADVDLIDIKDVEDLRSDTEYDIEQITEGKGKQKCEICNKMVLFKNYGKHTLNHKNDMFACASCPAKFKLQSNLKRHSLIHTGERPHLCDYCGRSFTQASTLTEHKRIHTGEKPYTCSHCKKKFSQYASFKIHVKRSHCSGVLRPWSDEFECTDCGLIFQSSEEIKVHSCNNTLTCEVCGRQFVTRNALRIHIRTHNGPRKYCCTICNVVFMRRILFTKHMARHRKVDHICPECGKAFANYSGLWSHRKIHSGDQPYTCTRCGRAFSQAGSLKSHMLIHTGEKPYTCEVCAKNFTQPNHLRYHMRTHSGEKPYTCKYCGKSFSLNGTLTVHERIHTGETPYICDLCDKGFYDSSSMKKHRNKHLLSKANVKFDVVLPKVIS